MKGTKLWQAAGSPIIQGRSRRQRPSWQQWLPAWIVAGAAAVGMTYLMPPWPSGPSWSLAGGVAGALVGAVIGVEVSRSMGWRFSVLWGIIVGVGLAAAVVVFGAYVIPV